MSNLSNVYYMNAKMAHKCKNKDNTKKKLIINTIINHCVMALFIAWLDYRIFYI